MFEHDRSAARGEMATRGLYVFKHEGQLGNAPAHALFERLQARRREDIVVPRSFADYIVSYDGKPVEMDAPIGVASGVALKRRC